MAVHSGGLAFLGGPVSGKVVWRSMNEDYPADLVSSLKELSNILISEEDVTSTINKIAQMAVQTIEPCDLAGVSLVINRDKVDSVGATDPLGAEIDKLQHEIGEGPCLTSIEKHATFKIDDFYEEKRWPKFSAEVADRGIRSGVSFVLEVSEESLAALNLYSKNPKAFGDQDIEFGSILASQAAVTLSNAQTHESDQRLVHQLEQSMQTRTIIGQAVGILMARGNMSREQAFDVLKRVSQRMNVKVNKLAQRVVDESEAKVTRE